MFKKIALLAGAGALAFGAVAPMASAVVVDHGTPHQYSDCVNWYKAPADALLPVIDSQKEIKETNYRLQDDAYKAWQNADSAKNTLDRNTNRTDEQNAMLKTLDSDVKVPGSVKNLKAGFDTAWKNYTDSLSRYLFSVAEYNTLVLKFAQCQEQLKEHPNNCQYWALAYRDATNLKQQAIDYKNDLNDAIKTINNTPLKYSGEAAVKTGKLAKANEGIADANAAITMYNKLIDEAVKGGKALNCEFSKNIGVAAAATKAADKKAADNNVNNAAAKEGNGLAATGSVASVAGLLSALAVLAGGAFVGIRRFNS